jgi:predicted GNAT superfamily acetyltransferase
MSGSAWQLANDAAMRAGVELHPLTSLEDADAILRVMRATWGEELPRELIKALAGSGNVPWGAFDGDELIGYVLGWAAVDPGDGLHEHSHMLAAAPDRRHGGVGYALKLAQRASCLDRDIHLVRWTFDPLVARNAHLNIGKLGAVCDRFHRDYYGQMPDTINVGDRSDRLVVAWCLDPDPCPGRKPERARTIVRSVGSSEAPEPELIGGEAIPGAEAVAIQVPRDHAALRAADPELGSAWREAVGTAIEDAVGEGFVVTAFEADRDGWRPTYYLTRRSGG